MKVLLLSQGRTIQDQPDYDASFRAAKFKGAPVEVVNIPFIGYISQHGEAAFYNEVLRINDEFNPDLVFFQFYHSGGDKGIVKCCRDLKASRNSPLIFGSIGDLFYTGILKYLARPLPNSILGLASCADAMFSTSMGNVADELARHGGRNIVFLPNAFCPEHFPDWESEILCERNYDVVMLCTKGRLIGRRPVVSFCNNLRRRRIVSGLTHHFQDRFAVFGRNWQGGSGKGVIPFNEQLKVYRNSRVVVDAPAPILHTDYYSSDRAFFMLASGTPLVHFHTPRFETMLRPEEHAYFVYRLKDVCSVCERALSLPPDVLAERAKNIRKFVKERHLISNRIDTILSTAEALMKHRQDGLPLDDALHAIRMWHFLPEIGLSNEYRYCVRNWVG